MIQCPKCGACVGDKPAPVPPPDSSRAPRPVQLDEFAAALRRDIVERNSVACEWVLHRIDKRVAEAAAAPKPTSAAMEQLREAMHRYDSTNDGDKRADVLRAARAVLVETDGGR